MSNLPFVQGAEGTPPVLPEALLAAYNGYAEMMVSGFQGAFNRIKVGKMDFALVEGGVARRVNNGDVVGVCLGMSGVDMCTWYEKTYEPTQEPEVPDLVWLWPDHNVFPEALPKQWQQKRNRQNQDRWDFRIARRSVWALLQPDPVTGQFFLTTDTPYIFDITSASLYGKSDVQQNYYKWAGLIQVCNRFSQPPNFICSPAMFLTRIRIDPTSTVSGVVYFEPLLTKSGALSYLDSATFAKVVETMQSQTVRDMLQVREILQWPKNSMSSQQGSPSVQPSAPSGPVVQEAPVPTTTVAQTTQPSTASATVAPTPGQSAVPMTEQNVSTPLITDASVKQPAQADVPPMQAATTLAQGANNVGKATESRLAQAAALLGSGSVAPSAQAAATAAKPAVAASKQPTGPAPVSANAADAIRGFADILS